MKILQCFCMWCFLNRRKKMYSFCCLNTVAHVTTCENIWMCKLRFKELSETPCFQMELIHKVPWCGDWDLSNIWVLSLTSALQSDSCFVALLVSVDTMRYLGHRLFFCLLQHWLMSAKSFPLTFTSHWQPLIQICLHRHKPHVLQKKIGKMKGNGIFYFYRILVLLNV